MDTRSSGCEQQLNDALDLLADGPSDSAVDVDNEPEKCKLLTWEKWVDLGGHNKNRTAIVNAPTLRMM